MQINDLIDRVAELQGGESLARDLRKFVNRRKLGLVYEESKPEYVRLISKPVIEGDLVNILPPRGTLENLTGNDEADEIWRVLSIEEGQAVVGSIETNDALEVRYDDLVAVARFDQIIYCGLSETGRVERGGDKPYHTVINGENYHALELLLFPYFHSVDCIYIDPPYNKEDSKDWKYNCDYVDGNDAYRHSKWLTMMEGRLRLAKKLLNPDESVLIVAIDEKEYLRLGLLLEQIFPDAKLQMISTIVNPSGVPRGGQFARTNEYLFVLLIGDATASGVVLSDEWRTGKKSSAGTPRWRPMRRQGSHDTRAERHRSFFPIYVEKETGKLLRCGEPLPLDVDRSTIKSDNPNEEIVWPVKPSGVEGCWQIGPDTIQRLLAEGYVRTRTRNEYGWILTYLAEGEVEKVENGTFAVLGRGGANNEIIVEGDKDPAFIPGVQWSIQSHSARDYGTSINNALLGGRSFSYPKSVYAVEDVLRFFILDKPESVVVDFFSGSGTTCHAVMRLNRQDGGNRRSVSITNNEVSYEEAVTLCEQGLRQGDDEWESHGIARYITIPRVTAAITGYTPDNEPVQGDYKFTDEFPMANGFEENAVFYDLKYLEPATITANLAFDEIAPLLWMRAGSVGPVITLGESDPDDATFELTDSYAVLFNYAYSPEFIERCHKRDIEHIFVVTDLDNEYRDLCREFRGKDVRQLYKSYLRSFEIGQDR